MSRRGAYGLLGLVASCWAATTTPAAQPQSAPSAPEPAAAADAAVAGMVLSVMLVETRQVTDVLGYPVPPDAGPDFMPWSSYIEMRVRVLEHLSGRTYSGHSRMVYVAHAAYMPGARLLVIAEPRTDARGFFVRWYSGADDDGDFCVPNEVADELRVRSALRDARRKQIEGGEYLCYQA